MKKLFSVLLVAAMVFSIVPFAVQASETLIDGNLQQIAENTLSVFGDYNLHSVVSLYNSGMEVEAKCFNFSPAGYVIVNVNDLSVPEFSPSALTPFAQDESANYVYAGPLNYYRITDGDAVTNLLTGACGQIGDLNYEYSAAGDIDVAAVSNGISRGSSVTITTDATPVTWSSSYYCGLDACAIILKYLDDHHNTNLLNASMDENEELQAYLVSGKYIPNTGTSAIQIVVGSGSYTGLNDFFSDRGTSFAVRWKTYLESDVSSIQASINSDYPVIMGTDPADDWSYGDHWIIAYGYHYMPGSGDYYIINDGYGNNGIYVTIAADHYDEVLYFD